MYLEQFLETKILFEDSASLLVKENKNIALSYNIIFQGSSSQWNDGNGNHFHRNIQHGGGNCRRLGI